MTAEAVQDAALLRAVADALSPGPPSRIGVAVSGGGDSLALLHLMARAAAEAGWSVHAITVDHRLRPEAAAEAVTVARLCDRIGVSHDTRAWQHGPVTGNLMDQARRARYRLIADWAAETAIGRVALGHTADDQAETFLMGLARGAGLDGLCGMRPDWLADGVHWCRPLLGVPRAALRAYLTRQGLAWIDDPTNEDPRFTRTQARQALRLLAPLGITAERLAGSARNLADARQALVEALAAAAARVAQEQAGALLLDRDGLSLMGAELRRRLWIAAIRWMAGADHPPRAANLLRLDRTIAEGREATLAGCRFRIRDGQVQITREPRALAAVTGPTDRIWDGRWIVEGPHEPGLDIRALGAGGLALCPDWRATGHSRDALIVSPAIWRGQALVAAPLAGRAGRWSASVSPTFAEFILSH